MVIKIHQACSTKNALFYNERKVDKKWASFYHSQNMPVINPFLGDRNDRYRVFQEVENRNTRVRKPGLHISVNPTVGDLVRLGDTGIRTEIDNLMKHMGYGSQPYLVYKHADLERVHFHIVSTRIDSETGKKIKDSYEKEKTQRFIKGLEEKYQLTKDDPSEKMNYRFSGSSKNLKQNLESLFTQLNRMEFISSREIYDQALGLFQVEIKRAGRGYLVFVTDEQGNPIRHPVRMSDFEERPKFYHLGKEAIKQTHEGTNYRNNNDKIAPSNLKSLIVKELILNFGYQLENDPFRIKKEKGVNRSRNNKGKRGTQRKF